MVKANPDLPRKELQRDAENMGPNGIKAPLDVKATRQELSQRYGAVLGKINGSHDEFKNHRIKSLLKRRFSSEGAYKKFMVSEAKQTMQDKLVKMDDLALKSKWRLQRFSQRSAERLAFLTRKQEIAADVLAAVEFKKEELKPLRALFAQGNQSLKNRHPYRSKIPFLSIKIPDPFDVMELGVMEKAAKEVQTESNQEKQALITKKEEKMKDFRGIEGSLRNALLIYNPQLVSELDQLIRDNAAGKPTLDKEIRKLFPGKLDQRQQAELDNMLLWTTELRSKKGRNAELFRRLGIAEVSGKADAVYPELAKMPLGGRVRMQWPTATGFDGWKTDQLMDFRVWSNNTGILTLVPLKPVSITTPAVVPANPLAPGTPAPGPTQKTFSPHEGGEIRLDPKKKMAWLTHDGTKPATDKDRYQHVEFSKIDMALAA